MTKKELFKSLIALTQVELPGYRIEVVGIDEWLSREEEK